MSNKQNPFELFDGEWFKDATSQLCQDGWPSFIVPLNIGIKKIRESHQELKSALESANAEITARIETERLMWNQAHIQEKALVALESENKKLSDENIELAWYKEQWQSIAGKANLKHLVDENARLREALENITVKGKGTSGAYELRAIAREALNNPAKPGEGESL